jgi:signal transduction histidine kinase
MPPGRRSPTVTGVAALLDVRGLRWRVVAGAGVLTFFQVVGTIGASHNGTADRDLDALALAVAVAGPLALVVLARWPRPVMWFVVAITLFYLLRGYAYGPVFATLAIATVATVASGHRTTAWSGLAAVLVGLFGVRNPVYDEPWSWTWVSGLVAWALLVLAVGEVIRIRRERALASRLAREESQRRQANEERLQIARELHDLVAHHISLINVQAGVALHILDRRPQQAQTALEAIKDASKEALVELRSLVGVLRDTSDAAPLHPSGRLASLDALVERSGHAGLIVHKSIEGVVRPLPSAVELAAVRIVQEAITNVVRHAGAHRAEVTVRYDEAALTVTVEDDGRGMVPGVEDGTGLVGMRERAEALGGGLVVDTAPAGGVRVRAVLPMRGAS